MSQNIFRRNSVIALWLLIVLSATWMGCTTTVKERQQGQPAGGVTGEATSEEGMGKYYYFDDVRVPSELNYRQNKSFVYETPGFKAGILVFSKWRLDVDSLMDFFNYQMGKDNWKAVNSFKGKESVLNFSKPDKTCTIKIVEKWYGTAVVEIRVGPLGEKKM
ncbi:MAG: hypothetical protein ABSG44_13555 [Thermodesulfobacteriota bacterium]|jgi:hypothetical protein